MKKMTKKELCDLLDEYEERYQVLYEENAKLRSRDLEVLDEIKNYRLSNRLESYERKSNVGKTVFSVIAFLNSMVHEESFRRLETLKVYLTPIAQCDGKTAEEIEKMEDETVDYSFILMRPDWFITVK